MPWSQVGHMWLGTCGWTRMVLTLASVMPERRIGTYLRHILVDGDRSLAETDDALQQFSGGARRL